MCSFYHLLLFSLSLPLSPSPPPPTHTHTHTHRYVVGVVFGFEHVLLAVAVWLRWAIHPVPKEVRVAIARREYLAHLSQEEEGDRQKDKLE